MEKFFDANKTKIMTWIKNSDEIDHIEEILEHLAIAQNVQPSIGPLWRVTAPSADVDPHFVEAIEAFDYIMGRRPSPARHQKLIELLCRDIELGPLETFTSHLTISRLGYIGTGDPCLTFLAQYVEGMGKRSQSIPFVKIEDPWRESWAIIATHLLKCHEGTDSQFILALQASLWHVLPDAGSAICERALMEPKILVSYRSCVPIRSLTSLKSHLQRIFECPIECPDHYDTEGHILFHILRNIGIVEFPTNYPAFEAVPLKDRWVDVVATLLILSDEPREIPPLDLQPTSRRAMLKDNACNLQAGNDVTVRHACILIWYLFPYIGDRGHQYRRSGDCFDLHSQSP